MSETTAAGKHEQAIRERYNGTCCWTPLDMDILFLLDQLTAERKSHRPRATRRRAA